MNYCVHSIQVLQNCIPLMYFGFFGWHKLIAKGDRTC